MEKETKAYYKMELNGEHIELSIHGDGQTITNMFIHAIKSDSKVANMIRMALLFDSLDDIKKELSDENKIDEILSKHGSKFTA